MHVSGEATCSVRKPGDAFEQVGLCVDMKRLGGSSLRLSEGGCCLPCILPTPSIDFYFVLSSLSVVLMHLNKCALVLA